MAKPHSKKKILVVGDVMVDQTWVVTTSRSSTSQHHGRVSTYSLENASAQTDMIGGAATVARRIAHFEHPSVVIGGWSDDLEQKLKSHLHPLVPEEKSQKHVSFLRGATTTFDSLKCRVYERRDGVPKLERRYDKDLRRSDHAEISVDWPAAKEISVVVVTDFAKGFLALPGIVRNLQKYKGLPFILRAKGGDSQRTIADLPWSLLCPNREDFGRLMGFLPPGRKVMQTFNLVGEHEKGIAVHPLVLEKLSSFRTRFLTRDKAMLLKLDREGALLLDDRGNVVAFPISQDHQGDWAGVSAGDFLIATLAAEIARSERSRLASSWTNEIAKAVCDATKYCQRAEWVEHSFASGKWYGRCFDLEEGTSSRTKPVPLEPGSLDDLLKKAENARCARSMLEDEKAINLYHARWYAKGFATTHSRLGVEIEALRQNITQFLEGKREDRHTFVSAVCGPPGAGKSTLVKGVADELGAKFLETSVAQWLSFDDFHLFLELIRSAQLDTHPRKVVAFIDEIDARLGSEPPYAKLLAPLWDREFIFRGQQRSLGKVAFILAGSNKTWQNREALMAASSHNEPKLGDLVSRLTTMPVQIPDLDDRRADIPYIIAELLLKRFPSASMVNAGVIRLFVESKSRFGTRSFTQAIESLDLVEDEEHRVRPAGTLRELLHDAALQLHFEQFQQNLVTTDAPPKPDTYILLCQ